MRRFFHQMMSHQERSTPGPRPSAPIADDEMVDMDWDLADDVIARAASCLFALQLQLRGVSGQEVRRLRGPTRRGDTTHVEIEAPGGVIVLQVNDADDSAALTVRLRALSEPVPEPVAAAVEQPAAQEEVVQAPEPEPPQEEVEEVQEEQPGAVPVFAVGQHGQSWEVLNNPNWIEH